jgi:glutaredoxin-like protein NrdH
MTEDQIIVFTTGPACFMCNTTKKALTKWGLPFEEVNINEHAEWGDTLRAAGYLQAPVVLVPEEDVWSGFRSEDLEYLKRRFL